MRWASKPSKRIERSFALFPVKCDDGVTVWLEHVWYVVLDDTRFVSMAFSTQKAAATRLAAILAGPPAYYLPRLPRPHRLEAEDSP